MSSLLGPVEYEELRKRVKQALEEASSLQPLVNLDTPLSTLKDRLPRYIVDSSGNELSDYLKNLDIALSALRDAVTSRMPPYSGAGYGQVTVGTSATQITSTSTPIKTVLIKADNANTGNVYIGFDNNVSTSNGFKLAPGESLSIPIDDLSKIWLVADTDNQKVYYIYMA